MALVHDEFTSNWSNLLIPARLTGAKEPCHFLINIKKKKTYRDRGDIPTPGICPIDLINKYATINCEV